MVTWKNLYDRIKGVDISADSVSSVNETAEEYIKLNQDQLMHGIDASGNQVKPGYANKYYARKKNRMNSLPGFGTPDARLTGEFYQQEKVKAEGDMIEVGSNVDYAGFLLKHYTDKILKLTSENKKNYAFGAFLQSLKKKIETVTGLKFS